MSLVLIALYKQSLKWRFFLDYLFPVRAAEVALILGFLLGFGGLFYLKRQRFWAMLNTEASRYGALLVMALIGVRYRFNAIEFLIALYGVYAVMFVNRSPKDSVLLMSLLEVDGRTPAALALFFFLCVPLVLIVRKTPLAEDLAVYAYYFLIIAVVVQLLEIRLKLERRKPFLTTLTGGAREARAYLNGLVASRRRWANDVGAFIALLAGFVMIASFAKQFYWNHLSRSLNINADARFEISRIGNGDETVRFPSYASEVVLPFKIKHPLSRPLVWRASGAGAVEIEARWFSENASKDSSPLLEARQPLPRDVLAGQSVDVALRLNRPPLPAGQSYTLAIALISGTDRFSTAENEILQVKVYLENPSGRDSFLHEARVNAFLRQKIEESWSSQLFSQRAYQSSIEIIGDNLYGGTISLRLTNKGRIPWPIQSRNPVRLGAVWMRKISEDDRSSAVHLAEQKFNLPEVIHPGETRSATIFLDPWKSPAADELKIGLVHDGRAWFYEYGDDTLKIVQISEDRVLHGPASIMRARNLNLLRQVEMVTIAQPVKSPAYKSRIRLVDTAAKDMVSFKSGSAVLNLEVTNLGNFPWSSAQAGSSTESTVVNIGILWFKKSSDGIKYANKIREERCALPFDISEKVTVQLPCRIGQALPSGDYEVWIGPVQEGVAWFFEKGDEVLNLPVRIE